VGLVLEYVEARGDALVGQGIGQGDLVDHAAAGHVDQEALRARAASASAFTRWRVPSPPAAVMTRMSAQRASSSSEGRYRWGEPSTGRRLW
jgi:hypothetical protein